MTTAASPPSDSSSRSTNSTGREQPRPAFSTRFVGNELSEEQRAAILKFASIIIRRDADKFAQPTASRLDMTEVAVFQREADGKAQARVVFEIDLGPESALRRQGPFVNDICARLQLTEVALRPREADGTMRARVVCEIDLTPEMRNSMGMLHGGCAVFLIHVCTSVALQALGMPMNNHNDLASSSIDTVFHAPAAAGAKLRLVNDTVWFSPRRTGTANTEIWDTANRRLIATGVHNGLQVSAAKL
ncbi:hypothetical protein ACG7TL_003300 [Trametes sanguinea]